jgi:hypothetical protein
MDYVSIFLAGVMLGIVACLVLFGLIVAFRPTPPTMHGRRKLVQWGPPEVAKMPVVEAGIVAYQFLGVTGLEDE